MLNNYLQCFLKPVLTNTIKTTFRKYIPRRAVLFVPANNLKKVLKAFLIDIDCIVLDCEDAVVLGHKAQARLNVRELLESGKPAKKRKYDLGVQVNDANSDLLREDLSVIVSAKNVPDTLILPKVNNSSDIQVFADLLNENVKSDKKIDLIIAIESPEAVINLVEICKSAKNLSEASKFKHVALMFGSGDYTALLGVRRSESLNELLYARLKIVTVAKAFQLQAIDTFCPNYQDQEILRKHSEEGARLGYTGKQVLHPQQVETVQKVFMPSEEDIKFAQKVLKIFGEHEKEGEALFRYKGHIISMPMMRWAQGVLDLANVLDILK